MNHSLENMERILGSRISGLHQYVLSDPVHLNYVSQNLCRMLGMQEDELQDEEKDLYGEHVYEADRSRYAAMIEQLAEKEQVLTEEYRLVRKDGSLIWVRDTVSSEKAEDGSMTALSVLTDITDLKHSNDSLEMLKENIPFGYIRYTCEKQPRVTHINQCMIDMLRFPKAEDGELDYLDLYKENVFLMLPMEERRRFSRYLDRAFSEDVPLAGDMTLLRCDGTRAHVFGWISRTVNEQGEAEFQSICMDVTDRYKSRQNSESKRYMKALTDVYDKIFEFNLDSNTVKCLYCKDDSSFKMFEDVAMQIEDAVEKWIVRSVAVSQQDEVRGFFRDFGQKQLFHGESGLPQMTYQALSSDGTLKQYTGVFIKVDDAVSMYCCREVKESAETAALKNENDQLKDGMRDLIRQFSDGLAAFEVDPKGMVKPLYASENVASFFGYTEEEWLVLTENFTPLDNFVSYSEATYEDFADLLKKGEAEFSYYDYRTGMEKKIKAVCSQKVADNKTSRYVMLYDVEETRQQKAEQLEEKRTVVIRTFGYFDVFVGDTPIAFRNKKSKELFALLVDRKGGFVTSEEAIGFLWEDEPVTPQTLSRYRKVALRLKNTLEEYGIPYVVEAVDGKRRIVLDKVQCDLYQYLSGKEEYAQLFKGSYLTNYSWGETTLGELASDRISE